MQSYFPEHHCFLILKKIIRTGGSPILKKKSKENQTGGSPILKMFKKEKRTGGSNTNWTRVGT